MFRAICSPPVQSLTGQRRHLWQYVCQAFNRVDKHRLKEIGPDRLCAEWILKNGGGVTIQQSSISMKIVNYMGLPSENTKITVSEIDGTNSTIMSIGFDHLKDCNSIRRVILDNCKYLEDEAMSQFHHVDQSLEELTINRCRNVSQTGLIDLIKSVPQLKRLIIGQDMPLIKDQTALLTELRKLLPRCEISIKKE